MTINRMMNERRYGHDLHAQQEIHATLMSCARERMWWFLYTNNDVKSGLGHIIYRKCSVHNQTGSAVVSWHYLIIASFFKEDPLSYMYRRLGRMVVVTKLYEHREGHK